MRRTVLAAWVILAWSLTAAAAPQAPGLTQAVAFPELRERHRRVMQPLVEAFATHAVRIDYLEEVGAG